MAYYPKIGRMMDGTVTLARTKFGQVTGRALTVSICVAILVTHEAEESLLMQSLATILVWALGIDAILEAVLLVVDTPKSSFRLNQVQKRSRLMKMISWYIVCAITGGPGTILLLKDFDSLCEPKVIVSMFMYIMALVNFDAQATALAGQPRVIISMVMYVIALINFNAQAADLADKPSMIASVSMYLIAFVVSSIKNLASRSNDD